MFCVCKICKYLQDSIKIRLRYTFSFLLTKEMLMTYFPIFHTKVFTSVCLFVGSLYLFLLRKIIAHTFVCTKSLSDAPHFKANNVNKNRIFFFRELPCHLCVIGRILQHRLWRDLAEGGSTSKDNRQMRRFSCLFFE